MRFDVRVDGDAEQILNIDDAEPANLHVMPRQLGARADENRFGAAPHLDGVVGHEPMAAHDQIERALALPDAALAHDEHAEAEDVQQHAVQQLADDEAVLENRRHLRHRHGRRHQRPQHRQVAALGFENHLAEHPKAAGDQDARHFVVLAHLAHRVGAVGRVQALEIAHLAVAEHEHASLAEVLVKAREREAGFLGVRAQDAAIEAAAAGENFEIEAQRFGTALQEFADRHAAAHRMLAGLARPARAALMPASATAAPGLAPQAAACEPRRRTAFAPATCLSPFRPAAALS